MALQGSVGDGPIINATITVTDAKRQLISETVSDLTAGYSLVIPDNTPLPVLVTATGGTDLVTGRPAEFPLRAIAFSSETTTLNLTPYTSLAVEMSYCRGKVNEKGMSEVWEMIDSTYNLGWVTSQSPDPMRDAITPENVATILLSSEALGEVFRRSEQALVGAGAQITTQEIVRELACDLKDGAFDGSGQSPMVAATLLAATVGVQLELLSGALHVDDQPVASLLDDALRTIQPTADASVLDVAAPQTLLAQTRKNLAALRGVYPDSDFLALELALLEATPDTVAARLDEVFSTSVRNFLAALAGRIALEDSSLQEDLRERRTSANKTGAPVLSFSADDLAVTPGESAVLSWASSNAELCFFDSDPTNEVGTDSLFETGQLDQSTEFTLSCVGPGGSVSETVLVEVTADGEPTARESSTGEGSTTGDGSSTVGNTAPEPTLSFFAAEDLIESGQATTLSWTSTGAQQCDASGGWNGARAVSGQMSTGSLTSATTFTLSCSGPGGNVMAMIRVEISAVMSLRWQPPTQNIDGTPLTDLNGYKLYYGQSSRQYDEVVEISDPNATNVDVVVSSGTYYLALTAIDVDGNESGYSNEVVKSLN